MADLRLHGSTSNNVRFILKNSATNQGMTGLTSASSDLIISTITDNEATATTYTAAGSTIETIATLGTFAAPTATKCRFREVDPTNHKGLYEFQFADARFAVSNAQRLIISVTGAANLLDTDYEIQLVQFNPYDAATLGLTSITAIKVKTDNLPADPADASDIASSFTSITATLTTIAGYIDTEVTSIKGVTDKLNTAMELDGAVYRFTSNALEEAPAGSGGGSGSAIEFTYTVTNSVSGLPIPSVEIWFATDSGIANIVWYGLTDAFGVARDSFGNKPFLDAGTYYIRLRKINISFADDVEVVS